MAKEKTQEEIAAEEAQRVAIIEQPHRMVDGEPVALTQEEIAARELEEQEAAAEQVIKQKAAGAAKADRELTALAQKDLVEKHIEKLEVEGDAETKQRIADLKEIINEAN